MIKQLLLSAGITLGTLGGAGLVGNTSAKADEPYYRDHYRRYDHERYDHRWDRNEYGVESNPRPTHRALDAGVSPRAREITNDRHQDRIYYRMPHPGHLWVFNRDDGRVVFSGHLHDGEFFSIDRRDNRAALDGRVLFDAHGHWDHYRLYVLFDGMR